MTAPAVRDKRRSRTLAHACRHIYAITRLRQQRHTRTCAYACRYRCSPHALTARANTRIETTYNQSAATAPLE